MNYLLNRNLSLEEKGLMALLLHLHEGGIKLTDATIEHYCGSYLTPIKAIKLIFPLRAMGYIEITRGVGEIHISSIREDNEIKE